jgi:hypothetical protein
MGDLYTDEGGARQPVALAAVRPPATLAVGGGDGAPARGHGGAPASATVGLRGGASLGLAAADPRLYGKRTAEAGTPAGRAATRAGCESNVYGEADVTPEVGAVVASGRR